MFPITPCVCVKIYLKTKQKNIYVYNLILCKIGKLPDDPTEEETASRRKKLDKCNLLDKKKL